MEKIDSRLRFAVLAEFRKAKANATEISERRASFLDRLTAAARLSVAF